MTAPTAVQGLDLSSWPALEPPSSPDAVLGLGPAVPVLAAATLRRLGTGASLRACAGADALLVIGPTGDLPWADGVTYLSRCRRLLLPCAVRPPLPVDVLEALVRARLAADVPGATGGLVVVLPDRLLALREPLFPADPAALRDLAGARTP